MKDNKNNPAGFTLIELLVVIAIIAILAAILFPVFAKARERAKQTTCVSNMKQIGVAFRTYSDDYDDHFPLSSHTTNEDTWIFALDKYTGTRAIYRCPSDESKNWYRAGAHQHNPRFTSYGTNMWMDPDLEGGHPDTTGYTTLSKVKSPSSTIYCAEMTPNTADDHFHAAWWHQGNSESQYETPGAGLASTRHNQGSVYFFCDGHAQWMRFDQTFNTARGLDLYDPRHS